jgi:hypothetical protein
MTPGKILLTLSLMPFLSTAYSQNFQQEPVPEVTDVTKINIIGFSYEKRIGKHQTLYGQAFSAVNFSFEYSDALGSESSFYVDPGLYLEYRFYYNGEKRQQKGKRTDMNSMNYLGVVDRTVLSKHPINSNYDMEKHYRTMNTLAAVWGFQRNYRKRFSLDFNIGPAIAFAKTTSTDLAGRTHTYNYNEFTVFGQFDIGFWLNKRK